MSWILFWQSHRGSIVCVRDAAKIHKGIVCGVWVYGPETIVWIADNNPRRGCPGLLSLQDFASGRQVWIERRASSWQGEAIVRQVDELIAEGRCYDLLAYNCEHFVTRAFGLKAESKQVQGWLAVGVLVAGVTLASVQATRR